MPCSESNSDSHCQRFLPDGVSRQWIFIGSIAVFVLVVVAAVIWVRANRDPPGFGPEPDEGWTFHPNATIESVVDGDTIAARIGSSNERVRLLGLDTPETVDPSRPVECYGPEASSHLAELLPPGTAITLIRDVEARDHYDRLLAYVYRSSDGLFVNLDLVAGGYAAVLTYQPNDHHATALTRAERQAVAAGRGLWGACGSPDVPLH